MTQKCPMCSEHVSADAAFCPKCGFEVEGAHHKDTNSESFSPHSKDAEEEQKGAEHAKSSALNLGAIYSNKKIMLSIAAVIIAALLGAAVFTGSLHLPSFEKFYPIYMSKGSTLFTGTAKNNTSNINANITENTQKTEENKTNISTAVEKSSNEDLSLRSRTPEQKMTDYLKANQPSTFPSFEKRIIEIEFDGNKSVLRFRTSTANPAQEALYLLGVEFIVFPEIASANTSGYNADGQLIMSPDTRLQETRARYWRKYHTKTDWFPNLNLTPECAIDTDCNDKNACTRDQCLKDGFCSNTVRVSEECPGLS